DVTDNPFASTHSLDHNPFDDPNPIRDDDDATNNAWQTSSPYASSQPPSTTTARAAALEERERELQRREAELNQRAEHIRKHGRNNWPFFFPLIYHSIPDEIPQQSQELITRIYQLWRVLAATLAINFLACLLILLSGSSDGGRDLGASIGYLFLIVPASFLLWYRPIYNGYMKEQALYFYLYFLFGGFHLLFSVYMLIGVPSTGSAGLINTIQMYAGGHIGAGVLGTFATVGWAVQGGGNAFFYRLIWRHNAEAGHSLDQAKQELTSHGMKAYFTRG
ncbi:scamp-domain-containing protein, partial [Fistulina hepatica ATCC 64428]